MKKDSRSHALWLALALLVVLGLACGFSIGGGAADDEAANLAATQQSLQATQNALAAQPTSTAQPTSAAAEPGQGEPTADSAAPDYYTEEWDGDTSLWTYIVTQGDESGFSIQARNGSMFFDITDENTYTYLTYDAYYYSDVRVDARARNTGANKNNVSLICRESEQGWYEFNIGNDGLYTILLYDPDEGYKDLYSGGSTAINTGKDANEYTAICEGNSLTLGINGVEVRTVTNTTLDEGRVGVGVSSFDIVPVQIEFEWVTISQP